MPKYLIDANLPYYFSLWKGMNYLHVYDLNDAWLDSEIWAYAVERKLTIITKDTDFASRVLLTSDPPTVIHIKLGNMKLKDLHRTLSRMWPEVLHFSERYRLVRVYQDRLEGIL